MTKPTPKKRMTQPTAAKVPTVTQVGPWLYGVIGPILRGLAYQRAFLGRRNPTWRFRVGACEFVAPAMDYVDRGQHPTLEQFKRFNPTAATAMKHHDDAAAALLAAAGTAHRALLRVAALRDLCAKLDQEFEGWRGAYPKEHGMNLLAENIVNLVGTEQLPSHHTNAAAWQWYGAAALALRAETAVASEFGRLDDAVDAAARETGHLHTLLNSLRGKLADDHGLPPVPFDSVSSLETLDGAAGLIESY